MFGLGKVSDTVSPATAAARAQLDADYAVARATSALAGNSNAAGDAAAQPGGARAIALQTRSRSATLGDFLVRPPRRGDHQTGTADSQQGALFDVRRRESCFRRALILADAVTAVVAVLLALDSGAHPLTLMFPVIVPLIVLAAKLAGLYDKDELVVDHSTLDELPRLINIATTFALCVWLARHYVVHGNPGTVHLLMLWAFVCVGLVISRSLARKLARRLAPVERCMLVGRSEVFERLEQKFASLRGAELVRNVGAAAVAHNHSRLREIVERDRIHRIIVDTDATSPSTTLELVRLTNATGLHVSLLPSMLGAVGTSVVFDDVRGLMMMGVPRFGLTRSSKFLKRTFDLAATCLVLVAVLPVMALIALAIKLDSRGPALFRQTRMGRDETPFEILKFRSMVDGAEALKDALRGHNEARDGLFKIDRDPRITRVGRLLRRTGLDELPQLFNVVAGNMSLVGPRPLVIDEDRHVKGFDRRRLQLTPGITGRWQTLGAARVPLSEMVKIDYLYISNWSPWLDFKIMIETVAYLVRGRGQ
jgi:exopolysaccharide biosynthesis polyprenyl glycosylphosphotransferase